MPVHTRGLNAALQSVQILVGHAKQGCSTCRTCQSLLCGSKWVWLVACGARQFGYTAFLWANASRRRNSDPMRHATMSPPDTNKRIDPTLWWDRAEMG